MTRHISGGCKCMNCISAIQLFNLSCALIAHFFFQGAFVENQCSEPKKLRTFCALLRTLFNRNGAKAQRKLFVGTWPIPLLSQRPVKTNCDNDLPREWLKAFIEGLITKITIITHYHIIITGSSHHYHITPVNGKPAAGEKWGSSQKRRKRKNVIMTLPRNGWNPLLKGLLQKLRSSHIITSLSQDHHTIITDHHIQLRKRNQIN